MKERLSKILTTTSCFAFMLLSSASIPTMAATAAVDDNNGIPPVAMAAVGHAALSNILEARAHFQQEFDTLDARIAAANISYPGRKTLIVIGPTGVGKSTLLVGLGRGNLLGGEDAHGDLILNGQIDGNRHIQIGHARAVAGTKMPGFHCLGDHTVLADLPGLFDHNEERDAVQTILSRRVFNKAAKAHMVLVVNVASLQRGGSFLPLLKQLNQTFGDFKRRDGETDALYSARVQEFYKMFSLVITRANPSSRATYLGILSEIADEAQQQGLEGMSLFLRDFVATANNVDTNRIMKLPMAEDGPYNPGFDNMLGQLLNEQHRRYQAPQELDIQMALSPAARVYLEGLHAPINEGIVAELSGQNSKDSILQTMRESTTQQTDLAKLTHLQTLNPASPMDELLKFGTIKGMPDTAKAKIKGSIDQIHILQKLIPDQATLAFQVATWQQALNPTITDAQEIERNSREAAIRAAEDRVRAIEKADADARILALKTQADKDKQAAVDAALKKEKIVVVAAPAQPAPQVPATAPKAAAKPAPKSVPKPAPKLTLAPRVQPIVSRLSQIADAHSDRNHANYGLNTVPKDLNNKAQLQLFINGMQRSVRCHNVTSLRDEGNCLIKELEKVTGLKSECVIS